MTQSEAVQQFLENISDLQKTRIENGFFALDEPVHVDGLGLCKVVEVDDQTDKVKVQPIASADADDADVQEFDSDRVNAIIDDEDLP